MQNLLFQILFSLLLVVSITMPVKVFAQTIFDRTYEGDSSLIITDALELADGSVLIVGTGESPPHILLVNVDPVGDTISSRMIQAPIAMDIYGGEMEHVGQDSVLISFGGMDTLGKYFWGLYLANKLGNHGWEKVFTREDLFSVGVQLDTSKVLECRLNHFK